MSIYTLIDGTSLTQLCSTNRFFLGNTWLPHPDPPLGAPCTWSASLNSSTVLRSSAPEVRCRSSPGPGPGFVCLGRESCVSGTIFCRDSPVLAPSGST